MEGDSDYASSTLSAVVFPQTTAHPLPCHGVVTDTGVETHEEQEHSRPVSLRITWTYHNETNTVKTAFSSPMPAL
jgi:hypothetical protein